MGKIGVRFIMIYWDNNQDRVSVGEEFYKLIEDIIGYSLKAEGVTVDWEISITLTDNESIKEINSEFRHIDSVTDVLSFPMLSYPTGRVFKECFLDNVFRPEDLDGDKLVLGDIVLSLERAQEQSDEFGHEFLREVCYLTVHSVLHLLGYDHMDEKDKKIMRSREEEILNKFDLSRGD